MKRWLLVGWLAVVVGILGYVTAYSCDLPPGHPEYDHLPPVSIIYRPEPNSDAVSKAVGGRCGQFSGFHRLFACSETGPRYGVPKGSWKITYDTSGAWGSPECILRGEYWRINCTIDNLGFGDCDP